jgi:hypothetical protein
MVHPPVVAELGRARRIHGDGRPSSPPEVRRSSLITCSKEPMVAVHDIVFGSRLDDLVVLMLGYLADQYTQHRAASPDSDAGRGCCVPTRSGSHPFVIDGRRTA